MLTVTEHHKKYSYNRICLKVNYKKIALRDARESESRFGVFCATLKHDAYVGGCCGALVGSIPRLIGGEGYILGTG
jgi:hypothetical protein